MQEFEHSFIWKIENFSFCQQKNGESLPSGGLFTGCFYIGHLLLYPRGKNKEYSNFVSSSIILFPEDDNDNFTCEIRAIGATGKTLETRKGDFFHSGEKTLQFDCFDFLAIKDVVEDAWSCTGDTLTVCIKLFGKTSQKYVSDEYFLCTKVGFDRHTFVFKNVPRGAVLNHSIACDSSRKLNLSISGTLEDVKIIGSKLGNGCINSLYIDFTFTLSFNDANDFPCSYSKKVKQFFSSDNSSKCEFHLKNLFREYINQISSYPSQGSLVWSLHCDFSNSNGTYFNFYEPKIDSTCMSINADTSHSTSTNVTQYPSLQDDLQALLNSRKLSDVKLLVDDETIEVHKNILIARSPIFAAMFDHQDMTENSRGIVDIVDIDAHTLKSFLQFLYTDALEEMDYEIATNLMIAAEKYQVLSLKEKCALFLRNEMTVDSVCEILSLADAVNHEHLKSAAIKFIVANSTKILSSPQWRTWMKNNMDSASLIFSELTQIHSSTATNASGIN